jgi:hypothetical protein
LLQLKLPSTTETSDWSSGPFKHRSSGRRITELLSQLTVQEICLSPVSSQPFTPKVSTYLSTKRDII